MSLKDDMMRHRIFVQRLQHTQFDVINSHLKTLQKTAIGEAFTGTAGADLKEILRNVMAPLRDVAIESLTDIAEYESAFAVKRYNRWLQTDLEPIDREILQKALITENMAINTVKREGKGYIVDESAPKRSISMAYAQYGRRKADEVYQVIRDSQAQDLGATETAEAIKGIINGLQTSQARTLAETSINYTTNLAKSQTINGASVIEYVQWDADTELNHCDYCEEMNGQIWPANEAPDTQVHYGCGCELIPAENPNG